MKKIKVALIGAGNRGKNVYIKYVKVFSDKIELVAVADIDPEKVRQVKEDYGLAENMCFSSGEELLERERLADIIFLCTMDREHYSLAAAAIKKGYHLLLEKPISPDLRECRELEALALKHKRHVLVCHVLRYAPRFQETKRIIDLDKIGNIVSIEACENIGYWHFAHSFVRGNWRDAEKSNSMIMQKCCHDMDVFLWLTGAHCRKVSSFGSLKYFKRENAPQGSAERCWLCDLKHDCPYNAERIYIDDPETGIANGKTEWASMFVVSPTPEKVREELKTNLFGRCVYKCDNNVADHQVVNLLMDNDITVSFHVCALTESMDRWLHICGTEGDIVARGNNITVTRFGSEPYTIDVEKLCTDLSGHGGGDRRLIEDVIRIVGSESDKDFGLTEISRSVESHYMAFAAEKSRKENGKVIDMDSFISEI